MDFLNAFALLNPSGAIGLAERGLMIQATLFMLIVAVPVLALTFFFAWYYRAPKDNKLPTGQAGNVPKYTPDWEHSKMEELIWWAIPFEIVLVLGALTWTSTHELDPPRPLSEAPPLVVQAVALEWKWLFVYPEQNIATVNFVALPVGQPVRFEVTADAPMNSFWIPRLGGQIYAMTGMVNRLNLVANEPGVFDGRSANYSGEGFAQMKFVAEAMPQEEFEEWVTSTKASSRYLDWQEYERLSEKSIAEAPVFYSSFQNNLYDTIVMQFMSLLSEHTH